MEQLAGAALVYSQFLGSRHLKGKDMPIDNNKLCNACISCLKDKAGRYCEHSCKNISRYSAADECRNRLTEADLDKRK